MILGVHFQSLHIALFALYGLLMSLSLKVATMSASEIDDKIDDMTLELHTRLGELHTRLGELHKRFKDMLGDPSSITEDAVTSIANAIF